MYSYNITCKEERLRLLSILMRIKQFIMVFISRAWSSILQFGGKKPHTNKHITLTFIYKMEIQPY